ncbi:hypothetical protein P20652_1593 [Pseudoalteromonas sp. BSi20652]|nr:hypothetical protein P20652_1593 [Pseudoalteromonas sp. BSi20652]
MLAGVFVYLIANRGSIFNSLKAYSLPPSYGICLSGMVTLLAFSRTIGTDALWHSVMGDDYVRVVKKLLKKE